MGIDVTPKGSLPVRPLVIAHHLGLKLFFDKLLFLIFRKNGKGGLETDRYGAIVQIWRNEGWGNRTYDVTGLQHGKPWEEETEGELEKRRSCKNLWGG